MNLTSSECKKIILEEAAKLGIEDIGIASIAIVDDIAQRQFDTWIENSHHGEMHYLDKYHDVRQNPELLLPSARSIIVCAINYYPRQKQPADAPQIASYALGVDYHEVVRAKLSTLADFIRSNFGGETRVCVDTAPLRERYWAVKAGIGFIGRNNQLIIPQKGSYFFLGEILTTIELPPDDPCTRSCLNCGACIKQCPTKAIKLDGSVDARRCLSYLTIEYRGELPDNLPLGNRVYGCDTCQTVCPHNFKAKPTEIEEFHPSKELLALDRQAMEEMTPEQFSSIFRHSAIKRTKHSGFKRNIEYLTKTARHD